MPKMIKDLYKISKNYGVHNMITIIIGTDTNVGKTYIGKKLAQQGKNVVKPIETGKETFDDIYESDSGQYAKIQNKKIEDVNLYFFSKPMSPHIASKIDNISINIDLVKQFILDKNNPYVELAGGLLVPITDNFTQLDLIKSLPNSEVILVVDNKLGAINHTLLTCEVLKSNNVKVKEVIYNDMNPNIDIEIKKDNIKIIESLR